MATFSSVAVLGAGTMGRRIAALLASAGLDVLLLNRASEGKDKNASVKAAFKSLLTDAPTPYYTEKALRRITLGNFDEDLPKISEVDLIIEAIREDLNDKRALFSQVEAYLNPKTIVASNTSGLPVSLLAKGRTALFEDCFVGGIHFFNPPRVLPLVELIPAKKTKPEIIDRVQCFLENDLGSRVVRANDTPCFVANRIGMFATMLAIDEVTKGNVSIVEVEELTGPLVGRPKSATFRTADLVGLQTIQLVTEHLHNSLVHDPQREVFKVPEFLRKLVERGDTGADRKRGFSAKEKDQFVYLNFETLKYEPSQGANLGDLKAIGKMKKVSDRIAALLEDSGRAGDFTRTFFLGLLNYCAQCIPEVSDDPSSIDAAMRYGFGWEVGPFELWDQIGSEKIATMMTGQGLSIPGWAAERIAEGASLSTDTGLPPTASSSGSGSSEQLLLAMPEAALFDVGDNVLRFELRSKGNTLSTAALAALESTLDKVASEHWAGLIIGDAKAENFCGGANLAEIGGAVKAGRFDEIDTLVRQFQRIMNRIYSFEKPVVGVIKGIAFGGGCELSIALPHIVAHPNSWIALVELGVGLIPAGCGSTHLAAWAASASKADTLVDLLPFLRVAFERIAMATVSKSAQNAIEMGFFTSQTRIVMNPDWLVDAAKNEVLRLANGYIPRAPREPFMVAGVEGRAVLETGIANMLNGGYISEHDAHLARTLAFVMTGGNLSAPTVVPQQYLLDLERKAFIRLLKTEKTQQRIAHFFATHKPLKN